jgi:ABC-2 type transport system permease protein
MDIMWPQYLALTVLGTIVFTGAIMRFKKRLD